MLMSEAKTATEMRHDIVRHLRYEIIRAEQNYITARESDDVKRSDVLVFHARLDTLRLITFAVMGMVVDGKVWMAADGPIP